MDRHIVCFSIPTFSITLARREDPSLQQRPVAVATSQSARSSITEASQEAQHDGVLPGLLVAQARQRCPSLHILPPRIAHVRQAHRALENTIRQFSPVWEPIQPGHFFFDLTGTTRLFGLACDATMRIKREITQQYGLVGVAGLASNKLVARIASTIVGPPRLCDIRHGSEEAFLAPLPIHALPLNSYHMKTLLPVLSDLNIHTLRDLADIELAHLEIILGPQARAIHAWAHGTDTAPVLCPPQQPQISATVTLAPAEIDRDRLHGTLYELLERICRQLRTQHRQCHHITLELQYHDGLELTTSHAIQSGTYWEIDLFPYATKLLARSFKRRIRVSRLTLRAEQLTRAVEQGELFREEPMNEPFITPQKLHRLTQSLDHIRTRFGPQAIWWGKTHATLHPSSRPL
ncbi:MAG: DNA polymerase IV [Nitrospirales bacterium]|nr:MAG: DNA polymerase IV [Nitrospirales bacterium]